MRQILALQKQIMNFKLHDNYGQFQGLIDKQWLLIDQQPEEKLLEIWEAINQIKPKKPNYK